MCASCDSKVYRVLDGYLASCECMEGYAENVVGECQKCYKYNG